MAFDSRSYVRDVINPLRDHPGDLPGDLPGHYGVTPGMDDPEIHEQLKRVRSYWRQRQGGVDTAAAVCARMLSRDERLQAEHGERMNQRDWWTAQAAQSRQDAAKGAQRFAEDLAAAYGALGRITRDRVDAMALHYPGLSRADVDDAISRAGLRVLNRLIELPAGPGLDAAAYRTLSTTLSRIGVPTVVHLLHPGTVPFRLLGPDRPTLDIAAVIAQRHAANAAADSNNSRSRKRACGVLETALSRGADLHRLALYQIVDLLRSGRRQQLPDSALVRKAVDVGLVLDDAQTIVLSLPDEDPAARVRELIGAGELHAARSAVAALPAADPARADLTAQVDALLNEVAGLRRRADDAIRAQREDEAGALLRDALRIAGDDEDLERRLAALPVAPVRDLVARLVDEGVTLSWSPPAVTGADLRYRVVCGDAPPRSPSDGDLVAEVTEPHATDHTPAAARTRHYAVFATAPGGTWSRPEVTTARVVPPVSGVRVRIEPDEIFCAWRIHPDAHGVRVHRTAGHRPVSDDDGEPLSTNTDSLYDRAPRADRDLYYSIVAVYRDENGAEVTAPAVVAHAPIRADAPAHVERLRVHVDAIDPTTAKATVAWTTPATGRVSIRRSGSPPPWSPGTTVSRADVEAWGEPLIGDRLVQGPETQIAVTVPSGRQVYVAFTFDQAGAAIVGEPVVLGVAEPVQQLLVRRIGDEAMVSWVWPPSVRLVEVAFAPAHGPALRRRLTYGQVEEHGCRLPVGSSAGTISVRAISRGQGGDLFSAPVQAALAGIATVLEYHLPRVGGMLHRGRRLLRVSVDQRCAEVGLHLVVAEGPAMPTRPEAGRTVGSWTGLTLEPGVALEEPFSVAGLSKPYWLRCFVTGPDGIRVVDPIDEMKVS